MRLTNRCSDYPPAVSPADCPGADEAIPRHDGDPTGVGGPSVHRSRGWSSRPFPTGSGQVSAGATTSLCRGGTVYHLALEALERQEPVDEAQRCTLLLALGEAQRKAGEHAEAQETFLRAADVARALETTESLVRAALGLERLTHPIDLAAVPAVRLLEEALQRLGAEDSFLMAKTLGGLAQALRPTSVQEQALVYAQQAVAMARRLADPELLGTNLEAMLFALQGPEHTKQRLAYASEMLQLSEAANDKQPLLDAHYWRVLCLLDWGYAGHQR